MTIPSPGEQQVDTLNFSSASPAVPVASPSSSIDTLRVIDIVPPGAPQIGLHYWMKQVLVRADEASNGFDPHSVHGLRTTLRRCRSMAEGIRVFDSNSGWKKMRRVGKALFSSLGALRDTHVMLEWLKALAASGDPSRERLAKLLDERECQQKKSAAAALDCFDLEQWEKWADELPERAIRIPLDSPVFAHLALERWQEAHALHTPALRNRSNCAFHDLRIGIKRFRYTIENFLPTLHAMWGDDLKSLQDLLGDVHDLDVLWQTALAAKAFPDAASRAHWRSRLLDERNRRIGEYREKMVGEKSLWAQWREELPKAEGLRSLALERLQIWASFTDPDFAHARHVADLSQQLYDQLPISGNVKGFNRKSCGEILFSAAVMHDTGRSKSNRGYHKTSARLVRKLRSPLGLQVHELRFAALLTRYHRGALPKETQRRYAALPLSKQKLMQFLAGILRLACVCDRGHDGRIRSLELDSSTPALTLYAEGYEESTPFAEHLAAARHLLELACRRPILIVPAKHSVIAA